MTKAELLRRAQEPSTWRGAVWLATALGVGISPEMALSISQAGMAIAGLIGVLTKDAKSP
jgi:hypothetical protein